MAGSNAVRVRAGVAADLNALYELDCLCFERPFRFSHGEMRRCTEDQGSFTLVAEGERLVGFIVVRVGEGAGYITTLDVHPEARRAGIAGLLLEAAEVEAARRSARTMALHVWSGNEAAIWFYEKQGYVRGSVEPGYYGRGLAAWVYGKTLGA